MALCDEFGEKRAQQHELGRREQVLFLKSVSLKFVTSQRILIEEFQGGTMNVKVAKPLQFLANMLLCTRLVTPKVAESKEMLGKMAHCLLGSVSCSQEKWMVSGFPESSEEMLLRSKVEIHGWILALPDMGCKN